MATKEICYACHSELVRVDDFPARRIGDEPLLKHALRIQFDSGYGMFVDEPSKRVVICSDCVIELIHRVPWVEAVLEI